MAPCSCECSAEQRARLFQFYDRAESGHLDKEDADGRQLLARLAPNKIERDNAHNGLLLCTYN